MSDVPVLLVQDEEHHLLVIPQVLTDRHMVDEVLAAANGEHGVRHPSEHSPSAEELDELDPTLVLLDRTLTEMEHLETPHLEALHPEVPHLEMPHLEMPHLEMPHLEMPHLDTPHPVREDGRTAHQPAPGLTTPPEHPNLMESRPLARAGASDTGDAGAGIGEGTNFEDLVSENLRLVAHLVAERVRRVPPHVRRDELLSAGYAALVAAARGFDPAKGVPFSRYAALRIRGALVDELRSADWAMRSVRAAARRQQAAHEELTATLGRVPTTEEVASHLGVDAQTVITTNADLHRAQVLSTDAFSPNMNAADLLLDANPTPEQVLEARERIGFLRDAVAELPARLRTVIEGCFFDERPMVEIATELGLTPSRISQMRADALVLLRDALNLQLHPERVAAPTRSTGCVARRRAAYFAAVANRSDYRGRLSHTIWPTQAA
jgi:RNA polymerase sigma factor FliA